MTAAEQRATDAVIKMHLVNCIAHLLERARMDHAGDGHMDFIAAQACLVQPSVAAYLESLDPVLLPLPRDGKKPLTFPGR
jgi:hypothetical protein